MYIATRGVRTKGGTTGSDVYSNFSLLRFVACGLLNEVDAKSRQEAHAWQT